MKKYPDMSEIIKKKEKHRRELARFHLRKISRWFSNCESGGSLLNRVEGQTV
jgi:hypothetical protein